MRTERITALRKSVASVLTFVLLCAGICSAQKTKARAPQTLTSITVAQVLDPGDKQQLTTGAVRQFTATGNYSDGSTQYLTQQVTWTTSNGDATVSATGLVTGVGVGAVSISASFSGITGSFSLTVVAPTLAGVVISPTSPSLLVGTSQQFSATAEYAAETISDVTSTATWQSSATTVATVNASGLVTAVGTGTANITATYKKKSASMTVTVTSTPPTNLGQWSSPQSLGMVAIHAALMNNGTVLVYSYPGPSPARVVDPVANTVTDVTFPSLLDIFCSGLSFLPDGRLFVDGGMLDSLYPKKAGIFNANIFDPSTNTWTPVPNMNYARWYPTTVPMPDGTIFVLAGTNQTGNIIQVATESYNPITNAWTELPTSAWVPTPVDDYPLMTLLNSGTLFYAAPRPDTQMYNPSTQTWSFVANRNFGYRYHAAVTLLPLSQQVMVVGGAATDAENGGDATNTTEMIDFSAQTPSWSYTAPLNIARYNHNLVYLADGTLLAVGGNQNSSYGLPVYQPELYNPTTGTWTLLPPQNGVRAYHSTAVLLPDGRVFSAGSDSKTPLEKTYEFYSPAYLFNGPQPTITSSPTSVTYGQQFTISTPDAATIQRVAIIRPGAVTHANHMDDHYYIDLTWSAGTGLLNLTAPSSPTQAAPGYYMLVIVNSSGVPSVMPFIQLQTSSSAKAAKRKVK